MSQWVLTITGDVMTIQTLRRLTPGEMNSPSMKVGQRDFDIAIKSKLGDCISTSLASVSGETMYPESDKQGDDPTSDMIYEDYEGLLTISRMMINTLGLR